jgi:hypothetical protein
LVKFRELFSEESGLEMGDFDEKLKHEKEVAFLPFFLRTSGNIFG